MCDGAHDIGRKYGFSLGGWLAVGVEVGNPVSKDGERQSEARDGERQQANAPQNECQRIVAMGDRAASDNHRQTANAEQGRRIPDEDVGLPELLLHIRSLPGRAGAPTIEPSTLQTKGGLSANELRCEEDDGQREESRAECQ